MNGVTFHAGESTTMLRDFVLENGKVSVEEARISLGWKPGFVQSILSILVKNQTIVRCGETTSGGLIYCMASEGRPDPTGGNTPARSGDAKTNMWRSMKLSGRFTFLDIQMLSSTEEAPVSEKDVADFVRYLHRAGYVKKAPNPRAALSPRLYRLIKYTGPRPPTEKRVLAVFDPNQNRLSHVGGQSE